MSCVVLLRCEQLFATRNRHYQNALQGHKNGNLTKISVLEVVVLATPRERAAMRFQAWQGSDN